MYDSHFIDAFLDLRFQIQATNTEMDGEFATENGYK